ncbi:lantibiotic dehydratase [Kitasatospora sp. NPDC052868]|uniref:lantibiotic dehydratase n=1 Tax=Kitasatospora sp. NPDC052868 TaxID=3364060 RepID=UPI0037C56E2F
MPHPAQPAAPVRVPPARTAPYALVRTTALPLPAQSAAAAALRALLDRLTAVEAEDAALRPALGDDLFASRAAHTEEFHRQVVLPLRRALYNGRRPGAALLTRLGDLPARVPRLAEWLALQERRAGLLDELAGATPPALAAERAALAELCRSPDFTRAIALTSADLLRAVATAGRGEGGRRARKEEPAVLRHALRASTKTSPLSWFTTVGWAAETTAAATAECPGPGRPALRPVVRENRTLVGALTEALLAEPRRRRALPHRMTSTARVADGRAHYARSQVLFAGGRHLVVREEKVELPARAALDVLAALTADPAPCALLADRLAAALGRPPGDPSATGFVDRLTEAGLLVPSDPVHPQDQAPLRRLADWLRQWPEDADLADRIEQLADDTAGFAATDADRRPALLTALGDGWHRLLADSGRPVPADAAPLTVLSEDVVAPAPLPTRPLLDQADHTALGELTALAELFDLGHLMRRAARDRFVARYGPGGSCPHPWEFGAELAAAWEDAGRPADPAHSTGEREELTSLRKEFTAAGPAADGPEIILPADLVRDLAARLPDWTAARPLSYSYFVQRDHADGLLCVNHVYGGWGRFTSRFLDSVDPGAADAVTRQIRHGLGDAARAAQIRPVGGFNANLHPLLLADEIGPDRRWTSLAEHDLDLVHDPVGDQLRLRLRATGELLDVLYLGFLAPVMLPQRIGPLLADHPGGVVDFRPLLPRRTVPAPGGEVVRTPRLRHRHLVLARRRWHLPAPVLDALRADLAADQEVPVATAARWRALLDLPDRLFLHPVPGAPAGRPVEDFLARLNAPKPQALDLGNALHLRCLAKWLTRHPGGAVLEEALPAPGGHDRPRHAVELVVETYRPARPPRSGPHP